jgi:PAS domain S-box-containing protein
MTSRPKDAPDEAFVHRYWRSAAPAADRLPDLAPGTITDDQFRLLADNLPTLCWIANADGYIVWYNRRWHEYCGTTPEEMEGWGWQSVHDPDLLPQVMERWTASVSSGEPFEMTFPLRGADGVFRPFLTRIQPVRDVSGNVARWFGVNTEVSAQLTAEAALRESEERLTFLDRLAVETAPLGDADGVLATTTRLLGEHLKLSVCAYADMDEDEDGFTIRGDWAAPGSQSIVGHYSLADFGRLAVKNLTAGMPLVVNDNLRELAPQEAAMFRSIGIAATICMPLVKEGRLTALMAVHDLVPRVWIEPEIALLREVTGRSWAHVERVAAIAELRVSEARYRTLFESIESGFCVVEVDLATRGNRIDYRVVEANPAFYRQTGFSETITNRWLREAEPALEEHWYETYARVARTGVPERFEQDSELLGRWFDVFAFRVGAPEEWRVGILFNDISARRKAEEQLRDSEARLRAVVDAAPVGLVFADAGGRITGFNARVEEIIGRPITPSEGTQSYGTDYVAFHADGRRVEAGEYPLAQVVGGETDRAELEAQVQLPDGMLRWVRYIATPMKDETGELIGGVVASLNIDQEKRFAESLAHEVERALADLEATQEALRQSQKLEAMGQLTGGVAHDFNNLLTPIIGSLDMLQRRGATNERERRLIDGALQSAEKAKMLVQRLLAFARRQHIGAAGEGSSRRR